MDQSGGALAIKTLSEEDPVRALIAEIISVVAVSQWSFARFTGRNAGELLTSERVDRERDTFERLRDELRLQRVYTAKGPRIAAALAACTPPFESGITLVFADMRREFGVLSLLRTKDAGPFTSLEIQALTLALDASVDRLSGFAMALPAPPWKLPLTVDRPAMHVLDIELNVVLTWDAGVKAVRATRLPPAIEKTVHGLISSWTSDPSTHVAGVGQPVSFITVRTQPLAGPAGTFVGVLLDRAPGSQTFNRAALAYKLSTRELETLAMLLQGARLTEIAKTLNITGSTVQDHIKSMLEKTESRNRSEMIAKLLGPPFAGQ